MDNQALLVAEVTITFFIVGWIFFRGNSISKPNLLDLKLGNEIQEKNKLVTIETSSLNFLNQKKKFSSLAHLSHDDLNHDDPVLENMKQNKGQYKEQDFNPLRESKQINVVFMWNGHSWDAYEVLGLIAGSSFDKVTMRYKELHLRTTDDGERAFLMAAYVAIKKKTG